MLTVTEKHRGNSGGGRDLPAYVVGLVLRLPSDDDRDNVCKDNRAARQGGPN